MVQTLGSSLAVRGSDGNGIPNAARAPTIEDGRLGDFWINTATGEWYGPKGAGGWGGVRFIIGGSQGWSPVESIVSDGARRVRKIVDWVGGTGTKPAVNKFVGATGLVDLIADGVDVRGPAGLDGTTDPLCTVSGTVNAIVLSSGKGYDATGDLVDGQMFRFRASGANTGSVTIALDSLPGTYPASPIGLTAAPAGYVTGSDGAIMVATWRSATSRFIIEPEIPAAINTRNTPAGHMPATTVQAAIDNLDSRAAVASAAAIASIAFAASVKAIAVQGWAAAGDGGAAPWVRVASEPSHLLKMRSVDRFLPDGTTSSSNGGWWAAAADIVTPKMAATTGGTAAALNKALGPGNLVFLPAGDYTFEADITGGERAIFVAPNATANDWSKFKPRGIWLDNGNGSNIWRFRDRVFVDDGCLATGNFNDSFPGIFGTLFNWMPREASFLAISSQGRMAVVGMSRTGQQGQADDPLPQSSPYKASIGGCFGHINDETAYPRGGWAAYTDTVRMPGAGVTHGLENDTANAGAYVEYDPYAANDETTGFTSGIWNMSGGSVNGKIALNDASVAYFAGPNGARWGKGLVFHPLGLRDRGAGAATAIQMHGGHRVEWHRYNIGGTGGELAAYIDSRSFTAGTPVSFLSFGDATATLGVGTLFVGRPADTSSGIEIGGGATVDKQAYLDLVASSGADYSTRLLRAAGLNGAFSVAHKGDGAVTFSLESEAGGFFFTSNAKTWLRYATDLGLYLGVADTTVGRTTGVPMLPTVAGVPTGAISPAAGHVPVLIDNVNSRLYVRVGGAWKYAALI